MDAQAWYAMSAMPSVTTARLAMIAVLLSDSVLAFPAKSDPSGADETKLSPFTGAETEVRSPRPAPGIRSFGAGTVSMYAAR